MSYLQAHEDQLTKTHEKNEKKVFQLKGESSQKDKSLYSAEKSQGQRWFLQSSHGKGRGQYDENRQNKSLILCHYCKKLGHKEADCWTKAKDENNQASFIEQINYESKLFMAHFCENVVSSNVWFLYSRCSNHTLGTRSLFKELDESQQ